jgi:hypothetical protein
VKIGFRIVDLGFKNVENNKERTWIK